MQDLYFKLSLAEFIFLGMGGKATERRKEKRMAWKMRNGILRWCYGRSILWVHMATIKDLPGDHRERGTRQLILIERLIELFDTVWFKSVFILLLWFLFSDCLVGKFPWKQPQWWSSPFWPGVFCQRIWACFLTDRRWNFFCCVPLLLKKFFLWKLFVSHNSLLHQ